MATVQELRHADLSLRKLIVLKVTLAVVLDDMDLTDAQWDVLEPTFRPHRDR
jgi:hypothetical protein